MSHPDCHEGLDRDALHDRLDRAEHALLAMQRLVVLLRDLVPRAFEEGFRRRAPGDEPWLVDWLTSDTRRVLDPLFAPKSDTPQEP